jgi:hypothetical protein
MLLVLGITPDVVQVAIDATLQQQPRTTAASVPGCEQQQHLLHSSICSSHGSQQRCSEMHGGLWYRKTFMHGTLHRC